MESEITTTDRWMSQLQDGGYRDTMARRTIVDLLLNAQRALEPLELFELGRKQHAKLGLVTVYRTLERLEALGLVQRVHQPGGCNMYLRATCGHEHLLICTSCGRVEFFTGDDLSCLMERVQEKTGFQVQEHWLQLFGLCRDCQAK